MRRENYFNNKKIQPNVRKKFESNVFFDIESDSGAKLSLRETWNELKESLKNKEIVYDDLEKVLKTRFIQVLNGILEHEYSKNCVDINMKYYARSKKFLRAVIINSDECITTKRFLPMAEKMRSANRFSPKGVEWLYLGFDRYLNDAKKCCFAEVRADENSNIKFCEFKHNNVEHKVINLTIADDMDWEEICTKHVKTPEKTTVEFVLQLYCKLLSEEIFLPVKSEDKDVEYAPFQCMAQYFKSLGYDGIIYKSTVSKFGKNIVMFDKMSFEPTQIL